MKILSAKFCKKVMTIPTAKFCKTMKIPSAKICKKVMTIPSAKFCKKCMTISPQQRSVKKV